MTISSVKRKLKDDEKWMKYKNILSMAQKTNFDVINTEISNLHSGRKSRTLMIKKPNPDKVMEAVLQDAAYRSRLVEITNEIKYQSRLLTFTTDAVYDHILSNYKVELSYCSTKAERETVVRSLLSDGYNKQSEFETITDMCDSVIKDIDQMGWSVKNIVNLLDILTNRSSMTGVL